MSTTYAQITVLGNLVGDAEYKQVKDSTKVTLRVAVDFPRKDVNGNWVNEAEYYSVEYWGNVPDFQKPGLSKGRKVLIVGAVRTNEYEKDGKKNYFTFIKANSIIPTELENTGARSNGANNSAPNQGVQPPQNGFGGGYQQAPNNYAPAPVGFNPNGNGFAPPPNTGNGFGGGFNPNVPNNGQGFGQPQYPGFGGGNGQQY